MQFRTIDEWNEALWQEVAFIYEQSFPEHGRKSTAIIRRMFDRGLSQLHVAYEAAEPLAMALTGIDHRASILIMDYIAVRRTRRQQGIGQKLLEYVRSWAAKEGCKGIVIEVEADPTEDNLSRIHFWERCGFQLTEGIHQYIWVPEPYRAMVLQFHEKDPLPTDGATLFRYITHFHEKAYRSK